MELAIVVMAIVICILIILLIKVYNELLETKEDLRTKEDELYQSKMQFSIIKQFVQGHMQYTDADFIKYIKSYLRIK